ncbi:MAG: hypothetical protein AAGI14_11875 [Pseudomonadota bacterium]
MLDQITVWCSNLMQNAPVLAVAGLVALGVLAVLLIWQTVRLILASLRKISHLVQRRKHSRFNGISVIVADLAGPKGKQRSQELVLLLQKHLGAFTFGAPYEVTSMRQLKAKGAQGLRDTAKAHRDAFSAALVVWGQSERKSETSFQLMSRELDPETGYGRHETILLPEDLSEMTEAQERAAAYLFARAFQPGLADAVGFRLEKIKPVAELLETALENPGPIPADTLELIEDDFCTMALHCGDHEDLEYVVQLRRARLLSDGQLSRRTQIKARIDLGRALLSLSERRHNPTRIREAMDHLKQAIEILREHPVIGLATATSDAVRQGERMLTVRRKFSVTGGSVL